LDSLIGGQISLISGQISLIADLISRLLRYHNMLEKQ